MKRKRPLVYLALIIMNIGLILEAAGLLRFTPVEPVVLYGMMVFGIGCAIALIGVLFDR